MSNDFSMSLAFLPLAEGTPAERACFGQLAIALGSLRLSEGQCAFTDAFEPGPRVSGYHLAEWLAWNWWRLVGEPRPVGRRPDPDWRFSHDMSTIGEGYLWPPIQIWSDRERTILRVRPTQDSPFSAFRFTTNRDAILPTAAFQCAVEAFVQQMLGQMAGEGVADTNLHQVWQELDAERADPARALWRQLEAGLGRDPDEADPALIERLIADARRLGQDAVIELSVGHAADGAVPSATVLAELASRLGDDTQLTGITPIPRADLRLPPFPKPWQIGFATARQCRASLSLSAEQAVTDAALAEICGVSVEALRKQPSPGSGAGAPWSFLLTDQAAERGRTVLTARYRTGRRFALARLLGDRLTTPLDEPLRPATETHTWRQQLQRAFAAEFLCPFEALRDRLGGDYADDAREQAARHFQVSERTVTTMLVNHGLIDRGELPEEPDLAAA